MKLTGIPEKNNRNAKQGPISVYYDGGNLCELRPGSLVGEGAGPVARLRNLITLPGYLKSSRMVLISSRGDPRISPGDLIFGPPNFFAHRLAYPRPGNYCPDGSASLKKRRLASLPLQGG